MYKWWFDDVEFIFPVLKGDNIVWWCRVRGPDRGHIDLRTCSCSVECCCLLSEVSWFDGWCAIVLGSLENNSQLYWVPNSIFSTGIFHLIYWYEGTIFLSHFFNFLWKKSSSINIYLGMIVPSLWRVSIIRYNHVIKHIFFLWNLKKQPSSESDSLDKVTHTN